MSVYRVRLAFFCDHDPSLMPTVLAAVDEYTEDAWGGTPDFYDEALKNDPSRVREMTVLIPSEAVEALFAVPEVQAAPERPLYECSDGHGFYGDFSNGVHPCPDPGCGLPLRISGSLKGSEEKK